MNSQLLLVIALAILQWLSILAGTKLSQWLNPDVVISTWIDPTSFMFGNLQIIFILWVYQTILKYIKF